MARTDRKELMQKALLGFGLALLAVLLTAALAQAKPGDLDRSFGDGGKVVEGFCAHASFSATVDRRDRIVAAGTNNHFDNFCLMRFRQNGTLDRSFGDGGTVVADFGTDEEGALSVAIDSRGRIVAAGSASAVSPPWRRSLQAQWQRRLLIRHRRRGDDGIGTRATAYTVAIDSRDRILAAGTSEFEKFALARYDHRRHPRQLVRHRRHRDNGLPGPSRWRHLAGDRFPGPHRHGRPGSSQPRR